MSRMWKRREAGLFNPDAAYWRGERAEDIVTKRVAGYKKRKKRKPSKRRRRK